MYKYEIVNFFNNIVGSQSDYAHNRKTFISLTTADRSMLQAEDLQNDKSILI